MSQTKRLVVGLALSLCMARTARADALPAAPVPPPEPPPPYETVVTATTPLHGSGLPREQVPSNVQTITAEELASHHSLDLSQYMNESVVSVHSNSVQGNPLQPDLQYRGFLASPLLGAPQGLSLYMDGVRLNEPFGDTTNWDLLPTNAIRSVDIMPGSNPVFGLNTLGGALSLETKDGFSDPGIDGTLLYGSWGRKLGLVNAGAHGEKWGIFAAAQVLDEDGWRQLSPTRAEQAFVAGSYQSGASKADLILMGANTTLTGNGAAPEQLLAMDRTAIFTAPDQTKNQAFMSILRGETPLAPHLHLSGTAYFRTNRTRSVNGDQRDWAQCAAQPGILCSADDGGMETPVLDKAGAPVPFDDAYDAADNRTDTRQSSYGASAQLAVKAPIASHGNHFFVGAEGGQTRVRFRSQTTVATLGDDRSATDVGFLDPVSPIAVDSVSSDFGLYASDTFAIRPDLFFTVSGRFNLTSLSLEDQLGDALTGDHSFHRINPAVGLSYQPLRWLGGYASYSESSRAPTAIELTCASPDDPCRLPNAFVADPPLNQVVARTVEIGVRGAYRKDRLKLDYALAAFRTTDADDIIFISSGMVANQGYFSNVGDTRRQGVEAQLSGRRAFGEGNRLEWNVAYTYLDATFQTPFTALSATHPDAVNGSIAVPAGAHIPSIPRHIGKVGLRAVAALGLSVGVNVIADGSQYFRGDEANLLPQIPGYVVVNARVAYQIVPQLSVFLLADNITNARYSTFGVLGDATDVLGAAYDSPRFLGPGSPRAEWLGVDVHF